MAVTHRTEPTVADELARYERGELEYWKPNWHLFRWVVYVWQWRYRILEGTASTTTGLIMVVSPPRWLWIRFLAWCAGSSSERVRVFAMPRWKRMRVMYWRTLLQSDDETAGLPHVGSIGGV